MRRPATRPRLEKEVDDGFALRRTRRSAPGSYGRTRCSRPHHQRRGNCGAAPPRQGFRPARLRTQREDLRSRNVDESDQGGARRDLDPAAFQRVRHAALRTALHAGKLRLGHRSAQCPGRLLHRDRRARRVAERRRRQRDDRLIQPVLRPRQLHGADEFLALGLEPDHQRGRQERLSVRRVLGDLAGRADETRPRQRLRDADGLLHGTRIRERRLHRRLGVHERHDRERLAAAVPRPQQQHRRLVERRLEPGLRRCARRAGAVVPEPAVHDTGREPRVAREALPLRRRKQPLQRLRARCAAQLLRNHLGERADTGPLHPDQGLLHRAAGRQRADDQQCRSPAG